jgi:hypothetical protein
VKMVAEDRPLVSVSSRSVVLADALSW